MRAICFSWSGDLGPGVGSLYILIRCVLSIGFGTGIPGDHTIVRLLEGDGTHREEDYAGEEHVLDTDWHIGPGRRHLHESHWHHRQVLVKCQLDELCNKIAKSGGGGR